MGSYARGDTEGELMSDAEAIKPCHRCGGRADVIKYFQDLHQVECTVCGGESGYASRDHDGAICGWDSRLKWLAEDPERMRSYPLNWEEVDCD